MLAAAGAAFLRNGPDKKEQDQGDRFENVQHTVIELIKQTIFYLSTSTYQLPRFSPARQADQFKAIATASVQQPAERRESQPYLE